MVEQLRRRHWEDAEKVQIVAQTRVAGVSVAQVARRYGMNANLIFKWLRDPRYSMVADADPGFLPVTIAQAPDVKDLPVRPAPDPASGHIEIRTPGGCTVRIEGAFDPARVSALIRRLER